MCWNQLIQNINTYSGLVTAFTAILLTVFTGIYVRLTGRLVKIQTETSTQPMIGFNLSIEAQGSDFITHAHVTNNSRFFCQVWTNLNMKIYGREYKYSERYSGTEPWNILPGQTIVGWFSITEILLRAVNKSLPEAMSDTTTNVDKKVEVEIEIKAKGMPGGEINYPKLRWYLELSDRRVAWVYMS